MKLWGGEREPVPASQIDSKKVSVNKESIQEAACEVVSRTPSYTLVTSQRDTGFDDTGQEIGN